MNPRQRILAAIRRQPVDRIPTDIWATPEVHHMLQDHCGCDTLRADLGLPGHRRHRRRQAGLRGPVAARRGTGPPDRRVGHRAQVAGAQHRRLLGI